MNGIDAAQENAFAQAMERTFSQRPARRLAALPRKILYRRFPRRIRRQKARIRPLKHFSFFRKKIFGRILPYFAA
jgi:hypothetical protein